MDEASPIEIVVYFHDNSGLMLKVQDGQNMEAGSLFELVVDELKLESDELLKQVREVFSLWLVSDLLELQLKPNHIPFKLVCFWEELLEKYVHCSEEARQRDEPVIMFRRNVYVPLSVENEVSDERLLKYLFHEAKKNVIEGRFPLTSPIDCNEVAVLQAHIFQLENASGAIDNFGTPAFFKENLKEFLPTSRCKRNLLFNRGQNPENILSMKYQEMKDALDRLTLPELYSRYLGCKSLFAYGSAYFRGQVEHPGKKVDDPVWVGVNLKGVTVVCVADDAVLLQVPYHKLSWQFAESSNDSSNYLPCLFLHFPCQEDSQDVTRLLQIFSRSAMLIDNLIEACMVVNRSTTNEERVGNEQVIIETDRLALVTYDSEGRKIKSTIRIPKESAQKMNAAAAAANV